MGTDRQPRRRTLGLMALACLVAGASLAETGPSPAPLAGPEGRSEPTVLNTNITRINDEIAETLERRFAAQSRQKGEVIQSENLLARPVEKVVVDQMQAWRNRVDSAMKAYESATDGSERKAAEDLLIGIVGSPDAPVDIQRDCLKHLAEIALAAKFYAQAQQIYSQMVSRYPLHPDTPSVLYRQGLLFRRMGATELALSKFHAVMSTVVSLPERDISGYKALVLVAQAEIADTHFMTGQFERAAEYYRRVLKLADEDLNEAQVRLKLVKSFFELKDWKNVIVEGNQSIEKVGLSSQIAEVRFMMAEAFKRLGMQREALEQTLALLNAQQARSGKDPANWAYWQKRTGNKLANELYQQGDYLNALLIYQTLRQLPGGDEWESQALYQIGLIYERLEQPDRATEAYNQILALATKGQATNSVVSLSGTNSVASASATNRVADPATKPGSTNAPAAAARAQSPPVQPGLKLIREMAAWRLNNLRWDKSVDQKIRDLSLRRPEFTKTNLASASASVSTNQTAGAKATFP